MKKINVIFLGAGPTALAGIRELGENGINTFTIGINPYETALFSKYTKKLGYADPEKEPLKVINILNSFPNGKNSVNIIIPTGDESIEFLSKNKENLKNKFKFSLLENDTSEILLNKKNFSKLLENFNIPHPKTWIPSSQNSLEIWGKNAMYPCIIKPAVYHKWAKFFGLKKGFIVYSLQELLNTYKEISKKFDDLIVQEVIPGDDSNIVIFTANFTSKGVEHIFTGRKIRQYPAGFGTTTCAISENIEEIKLYAIKLLQNINYKGVCDVEFKYDNRDETYKIIEVNARIGRWYRLVTKSNQKPLLASVYSLANSEKKIEELPEVESLIWLFPIRDIPAIFKKKDFKALKYYLKKNKVWCIFDKKDPLPFFMYFIEMIYKFYKYQKEKKNV